VQARRAEFILILVTAAWGLTFPLIKSALADAAPMTFLALRFTLAALILAPFLAGPLRVPDWRAAGAGLLLGVILGTGWVLQTFGLTLTTASKSAFLTGTCVVFVPVFSRWFERGRPERSAVTGALVAALGIALLTRPESMRFNLGDWLTLGCAVMFALEIVALQILSQRHAPWAFMWPAIAATALMAAAGAILERPQVAWTPRLMGAIAFTGIVATALALVLHMRWQRETSSVRAGVIYSLEPVFALVFAAMFFGERMPPASLVGAAVVVSGVLISELGRREAVPAAGAGAGSSA
jgi:drug/metabolite transporter (DMT)-like permease